MCVILIDFFIRREDGEFLEVFQWKLRSDWQQMQSNLVMEYDTIHYSFVDTHKYAQLRWMSEKRTRHIWCYEHSGYANRTREPSWHEKVNDSPAPKSIPATSGPGGCSAWEKLTARLVASNEYSVSPASSFVHSLSTVRNYVRIRRKDSLHISSLEKSKCFDCFF